MSNQIFDSFYQKLKETNDTSLNSNNFKSTLIIARIFKSISDLNGISTLITPCRLVIDKNDNKILRMTKNYEQEIRSSGQTEQNLYDAIHNFNNINNGYPNCISRLTGSEANYAVVDFDSEYAFEKAQTDMGINLLESMEYTRTKKGYRFGGPWHKVFSGLKSKMHVDGEDVDFLLGGYREFSLPHPRYELSYIKDFKLTKNIEDLKLSWPEPFLNWISEKTTKYREPNQLLAAIYSKNPVLDYDTWFRIIAALASKYTKDECVNLMTPFWPAIKINEYEDKYDSITSTNYPKEKRLGIGSLIRLAKDCGYSPSNVPVPDIKEEKTDSEIFKKVMSYMNTPASAQEYLIPEAQLLPVGGGTLISGAPSTGKTTVVLGGLLMPGLIYNEYVFGKYRIKKVKTLYIQSDLNKNQFTDRFLAPYKYDETIHSDILKFIHTKEIPSEINFSNESNFLGILGQAAKDDYKMIVIDNYTSLWPEAVYGGQSNGKGINAQSQSMIFWDKIVDVAKKNDLHILLLSHAAKGISERPELISMDNILGSFTKPAFQVIGCDVRVDMHVQEISNTNFDKPKKFTTWIRRNGEGLLVPLKNVECLEKMQYNIIKGDTMYLSFDSYIGKIANENIDYSAKDKEMTSSHKKVVDFLNQSFGKTVTLGEIANECKLSMKWVHKILDNKITGLIKINDIKGRGHKTKYKVDGKCDITYRSLSDEIEIPSASIVDEYLKNM